MKSEMNLTLIYRSIAIRACAACMLLCLPQVSLAVDGIDFFADLPSAKAANVENNPYVLYFGATWCGPCKQMKSVTFEVIKDDDRADEYQWLKYDIDESPEIATRYGIVSVPSIVVLDAERNPVAVGAGFMTADRLLKFIQDSLANPQTFPTALSELAKTLEEATDAKERVEGVRVILTELANVERPDRTDILKLLVDQPTQMQRLILASLEDEPLAIRAAATEALTAYAGKSIGFDPFATSKVRAEQFKLLKSEMSFGR